MSVDAGTPSIQTHIPPEILPFIKILEEARLLAQTGRRTVLGLVGAPGAGKTTLARALHRALENQSVVLPMDGFHLSNVVLESLGRRDRKGAPDTFDSAGFVALLERVRRQTPRSGTIYAPEFDRNLDESIGGVISIPDDIPLVIVEGNYLLHKSDGWYPIANCLDRSWFIDPPEALRQERLIQRHERFGMPASQARAWALGTDQRNAELVLTTRSRADRIISAPTDLPADVLV